MYSTERKIVRGNRDFRRVSRLVSKDEGIVLRSRHGLHVGKALIQCKLSALTPRSGVQGVLPQLRNA